MARTTDTQRGALIAFDIAVVKATQPDLFPDALGVDFWRDILTAAVDQLDDCGALLTARSVPYGR